MSGSRDSGLLWLLLGGAVVYVLYTQTQSGGALQSVGESVTAALSGWQNVNAGPTWVPVINQVESSLGLPANLLARQAYQESRFRPDVISGVTPSSAGALGILQLMPQYFSTVQVPVPFTTADTEAQINQAGQQMSALFAHFGDWGLALAGYNDGQANVDAYVAGTRDLPQETQDYVAQVLSDVPLPSVLTGTGVQNA